MITLNDGTRTLATLTDLDTTDAVRVIRTLRDEVARLGDDDAADTMLDLIDAAAVSL